MGEPSLGGEVGGERALLMGRNTRLRGDVDDDTRMLRLQDGRSLPAAVNRAHVVDVEQKAGVLLQCLASIHDDDLIGKDDERTSSVPWA